MSGLREIFGRRNIRGPARRSKGRGSFAGRRRESNGNRRVGNLNRYTARLFLQSRAEISLKRLTMQKVALPRLIPTREAAPSLPESPMRDQLKRASDAYGVPGEQKRVLVGCGAQMRFEKTIDNPLRQIQPDGILYDAMLTATD